MPPVRAVIFDLDDTVFDDAGCTLAGLRALAAEHPALAALPQTELFSRHAALLAALEGEVYAGRYRFDGTRWLTTVVHALWAPEAVAAAWADSAAPHCVAGTALTAFEGRVAWPATARQVPAEADRAAALWRLVQAAWQAGEAVDAALALPVYLRDKVAFTTAEREAARAAKNA